MATALRLFEDNEQVWQMFDGNPFNDNGDLPDGNAILSDMATDEEMDAVVAAGYGEKVEVLLSNDAGMLRYLGIVLDPAAEDDWADDETFLDTVKGAAEDKTAGWSHYGAYGASDSRWIFIPRI